VIGVRELDGGTPNVSPEDAIARRPFVHVLELVLAPTSRCLRITTDDQRVADYVWSSYGDIVRAGPTPAAMDEGGIITASTPAAITFNGVPLDRTAPATGKNPWTSGAYIVDQFVWRALAADPEWIPLYASAVSIDGQAIVIAGAGGVGKTTLALALAGSGAGVYGDEMILIRSRDRMVSAIARRLIVRDGTLELLGNDDLAGRIRSIGVPGARPALAPLAAIVLVERGSDTPSLSKLTAVRTAIALRPYLGPAIKSFAAFSALAETLSHSDCFRLTAAEPTATAAAVRQAISAS
jgi:hypothetical protein